MPIEQLFCALLPDGEMLFLKTPGVDVLSDSNIQFLRKPPDDDGGPYWLPKEQMVAVQRIERVQDRDGRHEIWNHTLLIPIQEYIMLTNPHRLLAKHFLSKSEYPPTELEALTL